MTIYPINQNRNFQILPQRVTGVFQSFVLRVSSQLKILLHSLILWFAFYESTHACCEISDAPSRQNFMFYTENDSHKISIINDLSFALMNYEANVFDSFSVYMFLLTSVDFM